MVAAVAQSTINKKKIKSCLVRAPFFSPLFNLLGCYFFFFFATLCFSPVTARATCVRIHSATRCATCARHLRPPGAPPTTTRGMKKKMTHRAHKHLRGAQTIYIYIYYLFIYFLGGGKPKCVDLWLLAPGSLLLLAPPQRGD